MSTRALEPARVAFATVSRRCIGPLLLGLALAGVAAQASRRQPGGGASADNLAVAWLHLPGVILAVTAVVATLEAWPLFGRDRDGQALVGRTLRTPLDGCGMATAGGVVAAAILLGAAGLLYAIALRGMTELEAPRAWERALAAPGRATLDATSDRVHLRSEGGGAIDAVRLNPLVTIGRGAAFMPVDLAVTVDGEGIATERRVRGHGEQILLPLPAPRVVHEVVVTRTSDPTLTLMFPAGSVELRSARPRSLAINLALAAACYALPALLALLAAATLRRALGLPALITFALATFVIVALVDLTPASAALNASARARWLLSEPITWLPIIAAAGVLLGCGTLASLWRSALARIREQRR